MADKPLPFDFEKTLTQQGKPESLPACPCTRPEAKLIAPVLFPACKPAMFVRTECAANGNESLFAFSMHSELRSVNGPARPNCFHGVKKF